MPDNSPSRRSLVSVTVVGSLNEDVLVVVDRLPGRGGTVIGRSASLAPGGKGANQAAAAGRRGLGVHMVGRVGDDPAGDRQLAALAEAGVNVGRVHRTPGVLTGSAMIPVEEGTGENLIVVVPGANAELTPEDAAVESVLRADVVLLQLEVPLATVQAAPRAATGTRGRPQPGPPPAPPSSTRRLRSRCRRTCWSASTCSCPTSTSWPSWPARFPLSAGPPSWPGWPGRPPGRRWWSRSGRAALWSYRRTGARRSCRRPHPWRRSTPRAPVTASAAPSRRPSPAVRRCPRRSATRGPRPRCRRPAPARAARCPATTRWGRCCLVSRPRAPSPDLRGWAEPRAGTGDTDTASRRTRDDRSGPTAPYGRTRRG